MPPSVLNLLARWLVLALGVLIATRMVPGIRCDGGATLVVVVVLLSFCNAVLRPLLLLFTLPKLEQRWFQVFLTGAKKMWI